MFEAPRLLFSSFLASSALALGAGGAASVSASVAAHAEEFHPPVSLALAGSQLGSSVQSNNWSGYDEGLLDTGTLAQSISAEWTVPTAAQHTAGQAEASATWIGIGGGCVNTTSGCSVTDPTLVQAGTEQDVSASGVASYSAWWEILPVPAITASITVNPGDRVKASISSSLPEVWTIDFTDLTNRASFTETVPYMSTMDSAEWIEEAPVEISAGSAPLSAGEAALPNLSADDFDLATLNGHSPNFKSADEIQMVNGSGGILATPSAPDSDADGFNVCTYSTSCTAVSS